jgi:hypothetical protein
MLKPIFYNFFVTLSCACWKGGQPEHCFAHILGSRAAMALIFSLMEASYKPPLIPQFFRILQIYLWPDVHTVAVFLGLKTLPHSEVARAHIILVLM